MGRIGQVPQRIAQLMQGEKLNVTENRPALHTALRRDRAQSLLVDGRDVMQEIAAQKPSMGQMVANYNKANGWVQPVNRFSPLCTLG